MATLFLTSGIHFYKDGKNGLISDRIKNRYFIEELTREVKGYSDIVFICNNPSDYENNELYSSLFIKALSLSGIKFNMVDIIDDRNWLFTKSLTSHADLIVMLGGNTNNQMEFLESIEFKEKIKGYKGVILGIDEGAINMCKDAYNSKSEYEDTVYYKGLGLTKLTVSPNFSFKNKKVIKEVLLGDSKNKPFIALENDSFIVLKGNTGKIFGDAYYFKDGEYKQIKNLNEIEI